jgi:hypothetical protein
MARKPNYRFARLERERNKAARKAERAKQKAERAELRRQEKAGQTADSEADDDSATNALADTSDDPVTASARNGEHA